MPRGRSRTRPRRKVWVPIDTGQLAVSPANEATTSEPTPQVGRSVFSQVRGASGTPLTATAITDAQGVHADFVRRFADGTILRIVGEHLTFNEETGTGSTIAGWSAGIILLPSEVFDPISGGIVTVPAAARPDPNSYDQADWIWHQSGWTDSGTDGRQTPLTRHVDNRSSRIIDGQKVPAYVFACDGGDPAAVLRVGFKGRILIMEA